MTGGEPDAAGAPGAEDAAPVDDAVRAPVDEESGGGVDGAAGAAGDIAPADPLAAELEERTADLQRVTAEYANYRRRAERERQVAMENARATLLLELVGVVDDLDRARGHGDLEDGPLKAFASKMAGLLEAQKVEAFGVEGDDFDPELHEAVQDESDGGRQVLGAVLRKGYRVGERVLRTAMVVVTSPAGN